MQSCANAAISKSYHQRGNCRSGRGGEEEPVETQHSVFSRGRRNVAISAKKRPYSHAAFKSQISLSFHEASTCVKKQQPSSPLRTARHADVLANVCVYSNRTDCRMARMCRPVGRSCIQRPPVSCSATLGAGRKRAHSKTARLPRCAGRGETAGPIVLGVCCATIIPPPSARERVILPMQNTQACAPSPASQHAAHDTKLAGRHGEP